MWRSGVANRAGVVRAVREIPGAGGDGGAELQFDRFLVCNRREFGSVT
jgi:hypothetical protein